MPSEVIHREEMIVFSTVGNEFKWPFSFPEFLFQPRIDDQNYALMNWSENRFPQKSIRLINLPSKEMYLPTVIDIFRYIFCTETIQA